MANINLPSLGHTAGYPGQWSDTINPVLEGLIVGETPAVIVQDMIFAGTAPIPVNSPVIKDGAGKLIIAAVGTPAIGITLVPISGTVADVGAPVLRAAAVAKHMVAWPAAFDNDAKKFAAFENADSPTQIVVKEVYFGSVVPTP